MRSIALRFRNLLAGVCLIWLQVGQVSATVFTWTNNATGDWFATNNWSPNGLPGSNDTVNLSSGTISFSAPVKFTGQFNWTGGALTGNALTIATNSTLTISGGATKSLWNALTNAGTVVWSGGTLEVDYTSAQNQFGYIQNLAGAVWDIQAGQARACSIPLPMARIFRTPAW